MTVEPIPNTGGEISTAIDILSTESKQIANEIEAFESFEKRVSKIDPAPNTVSPINGPGYQQSSTDHRCMKVRAAYKETVMSVPHYDTEYDDTYFSSIREEFGNDIAIALTKSSNFTSVSKSALLDSLKNAITERKKLQDVVLSERKSITTAHDRLSDIAGYINDMPRNRLENLTFEVLDAHRNKIILLFDECDTIASKRQEKIRKIQNKMNKNSSSPNIHEYLYQSMSTSYPVLSIIGRIGKNIKALENDIHAAIIHFAFELETT